MYHEVVYRNDELKRELEQASQKAARGWRFRNLQPRRPKPLATVTTILGSILVAVGQWLAAQGRSSLASSA
jgi:hypothetical protein